MGTWMLSHVLPRKLKAGIWLLAEDPATAANTTVRVIDRKATMNPAKAMVNVNDEFWVNGLVFYSVQ